MAALPAFQSLTAQLKGLQGRAPSAHGLSELPAECQAICVDHLVDNLAHSLLAFDQALAGCTTAQGSRLGALAEYCQHATADAKGDQAFVARIRRQSLERHAYISPTPLKLALKNIAKHLGIEVFEDESTFTLGGKGIVLDLDFDSIEDSRGAKITRAHFTYEMDGGEDPEMDRLLEFTLTLENLQPFALALEQLVRLDTLMHTQPGIDAFKHMRDLTADYKGGHSDVEISQLLNERKSLPLFYTRKPYLSFVLDVPQLACDFLSQGQLDLDGLLSQQARFTCTTVHVEYLGSSQHNYNLVFRPPVPISRHTGLRISSVLNERQEQSKSSATRDDIDSGVALATLLVYPFDDDKCQKDDVYRHSFADQRSSLQNYRLSSDFQQGFLLEQMPLPDIKRVDHILEIVNQQLWLNRLFKSAIQKSKRLPRRSDDPFTLRGQSQDLNNPLFFPSEPSDAIDIHLSIQGNTLNISFSLAIQTKTININLTVHADGSIACSVLPEDTVFDPSRIKNVLSYGNLPALVRWMQLNV